jgi:hypothetical protein
LPISGSCQRIKFTAGYVYVPYWTPANEYPLLMHVLIHEAGVIAFWSTSYAARTRDEVSTTHALATDQPEGREEEEVGVGEAEVLVEAREIGVR